MAGKERESIFGSVDEPETDDIGDLSEFGTKPRPAESSVRWRAYLRGLTMESAASLFARSERRSSPRTHLNSPSARN